MLTISFTSIPPRFGTLPNVVDSLLNQTIPVRVVVSLPQTYLRYPGYVAIPDLPQSVEVRRTPKDFGPATKLLGCLNDPQATDILYCDDDWHYAPKWAEALLAVRATSTSAVAASTFPVSRLKRSAAPMLDQVAQGFAGVLVHKDMFGSDVFDLPRSAYAADDIWLSGYLASRNVPIFKADKARALCSPAATDGAQLQDLRVNGLSRRDANEACADAITRRFGIWPKKTPQAEPGGLR